VSARRRFLAGLGALAASTAWSQAKGRVHRVTLFSYFILPESLEQVRARWLARFRELGFAAGEIALTTVNSGLDPTEAESRARSVVASRPDVICVASTAWTTIFMRLTKDIPIVFYNVADPVRAGLVADFGRPGGNVTGATNRFFDLQSKRIELLRELRPGIRRIAIVHPQGGTGRRRRIHLRPRVPDPRAAALVRAIAAGDGVRRQHGGAGGGVVSLGEQRPTHAQRAIDIAARILRGERPATIPVDQLSRFHLALNLKVARQLGIAIPQEVRLRADEVIE
jgi:putative ABC transport system substrate-binding protein